MALSSLAGVGALPRISARRVRVLGSGGSRAPSHPKARPPAVKASVMPDVGGAPYVATCARGLEDTVAAEVTENGGEVWATRRGIVEAGPPSLDMRRVRTADNVGGLVTRLGSLERSQSDLQAMEKAVEDHAGNIDAAKRLVDSYRGGMRREETAPPEKEDGRVRFRATVERRSVNESKHAYSSQEVAGRIGSAVERATGWVVNLEDFDVEAYGIVHDSLLTVSLSLLYGLDGKGKSVAKPLHCLRAWRMELGMTSLKPSVAASLIRMTSIASLSSGTNPNVVLADPCGGCGTICLEAAESLNNVTAHTGDADEYCVKAARKNAEAGGLSDRVHVHHWDAAQLPLESESVDAVVSDLPFGVKSKAARRGKKNLYSSVGSETARILKAGGEAVFMASGKLAVNAIPEGGNGLLKVEESRKVDMEGIPVELLKLIKVPSSPPPFSRNKRQRSDDADGEAEGVK